MELGAQEKIEDTKHDIDEAVNNPVRFYGFHYMIAFMHVTCLREMDWAESECLT